MIPPFDHILVPLDFTQKNNLALEHSLKLAKRDHSRVTLLHVVETIDYAEDEEIAEFYESMKRRARANLSTCAERFREANIAVAEKIVLGKRCHGIITYAMRKNVDLIVLSSHKVQLDQPPEGLATLSYQVSILCQCPVLLVK